MALTPEQFDAKLKAKLKALNTAKLIYPIATKIHNDQLHRLFDKGVGGDNKDLGEYSSTPAYFSKKQFKRTGAFKAQGKKTERAKQVSQTTRKKKLAEGNSYQRTSMFLPFGYKQLRAIQGMETSFVNLTYSSDLRNDFASKLAIEGDTVVLKLSRGINKGKVAWLSDKYGTETFKHTKEEKEFFKTETTKALTKYLFA
jgi:hypothetical protein